MPSLSNLFLVSIPLVLLALFFQTGTPALVLHLIAEHVAFKVVRNLLATTYCYESVNTLSGGGNDAECFNIYNGKFTKVIAKGSSSVLQRLDANTGHVIPGLWDGHGHLLQFGESLDSVSIFGAASMQEVQKRLREYKVTRPETGSKKEWLRGVGWDQANFGGKWPTSSDLNIDDSFKDLYVMLDRVDVHCIWVSDKVLALLPSKLPQVPGGEIPAKGVFCDNAMDIVLQVYPKPDEARKTKFVKDAMVELNKLGIVGMHDAGVVPNDLKLYRDLSSDEDWTVRVNAMIECDVRNTFCPDAVERTSTSNGKFHVQGVKLFGGMNC
ncbi:hypothetical protein J1614_010862 [Plenodomus biglobosus]|nr:hypothetical protein J1614_010862 [Plenodomus biglobosus]